MDPTSRMCETVVFSGGATSSRRDPRCASSRTHARIAPMTAESMKSHAERSSSTLSSACATARSIASVVAKSCSPRSDTMAPKPSGRDSSGSASTTLTAAALSDARVAALPRSACIQRPSPISVGRNLEIGLRTRRGSVRSCSKIRSSSWWRSSTKRALSRSFEAARPRDVDLDDLADAAGSRAHDAHRVGEQDRLVDVVRDERDRAAMALPELGQEALRAGPRERVERAERLVHEQHLRVVRERARDRHALLHAARELLGVGVGEPRSGPSPRSASSPARRARRGRRP